MSDFAYENYKFDSDIYEEIETTYNLLKEQPSSGAEKFSFSTWEEARSSEDILQNEGFKTLFCS